MVSVFPIDGNSDGVHLFSLFLPEDFLDAPKIYIYITGRISQPQDQLYLCACILSKRWACQVQAHLHMEHMLLWPTPSCMLVMAHRSQLLYLASLDVFTFNWPWTILDWALWMNQPAAPDLTLLATRRPLKASCHFPFFFFFYIDSISVYILIKSHNES